MSDDKQEVEGHDGGTASTTSHSGDETYHASATDETKGSAGVSHGDVHFKASEGLDETASADSTTHGQHGSVGVTGSETAGEHAQGQASAGAHGVSASGGAFIGDSVGGSVHGGVHAGGVSASGSTGASIGDNVGGSFSVGATDKHSKITIEAGGKVALLAGFHGQVKISVDTKPITDDYDDVKKEWDRIV